VKNIVSFNEELKSFTLHKTKDPTISAYRYEFSDGLGNDYYVHILPINNEHGHYELEYLTQDMSYTSMTGGFIPFSISNTIFGDILSDFAKDPGFEEIHISPVDKRRAALYLRTMSSRFTYPEWQIIVDSSGDIVLKKLKTE
jgi:hypothetical protein